MKLGHNTMEANKNNCCAKSEGIVDHSPETRWFKKFHSGYQNLDNQTSSERPKTEDSKVMHQANSVSSIQKVSGKLGISVQ